MRRKKSMKKRVIGLSITAVVLAVIITTIAVIVHIQNEAKTVEVIPVSNISTFNYGDSSYSSGTVSSENMQSLYPDGQKVVSDIFVEQGQQVKIGDPLLQYDKASLELNLEKLELSLKTNENNIAAAKRQLVKYQNTTPYVPPTEPPIVIPPTPTPVPAATATLYDEVTADAQAFAGTGTTEDPFRFLCTAEYQITPAFMRQLLGIDPYTPDLNNPSVTTTVPFAAQFEVHEENSNFGEVLNLFVLDGTMTPKGTETPAPELTPTPVPTPDVSAASTKRSALPVTGNPSFYGPDLTAKQLSSENNNSGSGSDYADQKYTAEELKALIADKKQEIADLELAGKRGKIDYERAKLALENSKVISTVDGIVKTLIPQEEAAANATAFLVVTGENTFYLNGTLNEAQLGTVNIGDAVTAMDYSTGMNYDCTIVSIDDYPVDSQNGGYYGGSVNPNTSNYAFQATINGAEGFGEYTYLEITFSNAPVVDSSTLYIDKMYVRDDNGGSYVMKRNSENRLEKAYIHTGKILYGSYVEIKSGLTMEDYVAFPYGQDVHEGVRVVLQGSEDGSFPENGENSMIDPMFPENGMEPEGDVSIPEEDFDQGTESLPEGETPESGEDGSAVAKNPLLRDAPAPDEDTESIAEPQENQLEGGTAI